MAAHIMVIWLQFSPRMPSQPGAVMVRGSQLAPTLRAAAMQLPIAVAVAPTHDKSGPHGLSRLHVVPCVPGATQVMVAPTHSRPRPHPMVAHDAPAIGGGWQVPQALFLGTAQKVDAHCPLNAHGAPAASLPVTTHALGRLLRKKSLQ